MTSGGSTWIACAAMGSTWRVSGSILRWPLAAPLCATGSMDLAIRSRAGGRRFVSMRAKLHYALIAIVSTPLYAPEAPRVTIGVCAAICLGVLSAKTSSRSMLTEVKFAALAP